MQVESPDRYKKQPNQRPPLDILEVFVPDVTAARATCANCGAMREMGALLVYASGTGMVIRCPSQR